MEDQKYFKLLNRDENHHGFQFKTGLNIDAIPFDPVKENKCIPGGIYFSKSQDILRWLDVGHESFWIREVTIPDDAKIVELDEKLRADKVILGDKKSLLYVKTWKFLVSRNVDIHIENDNAFCWAAQSGYLNIVKYLIKQNINVHVEDDFAICWASRNGHLSVVKYLVSQGADIRARDDYAFKWCVNYGYFEVAKYLRSLGVRVNIYYF